MANGPADFPLNLSAKLRGADPDAFLFRLRPNQDADSAARLGGTRAGFSADGLIRPIGFGCKQL